MMRTLTWYEVTRKDYPQPTYFTSLLGYARNLIDELCQEISCAVVGGSTIIGTPTYTSDFEIIIVSKSEDTQPLIEKLKPLRIEAEHFSIPLDGPIILTPGEIARGCHTLTPGYTRHLHYAAARGGLLIGSAETLKPLPISNLEDARTYIARKLKKVRAWLLHRDPITSDKPEYMDMRAEVLNTFKYAGRRVADALNGKPLEEEEPWLPYIHPVIEPLVAQFEAARRHHIEALNWQIQALGQEPPICNEGLWLYMHLELDNLIPILEKYLSILEQTLV